MTSVLDPVRTAVDRRRVFAATIIGTTIEWYDFFIYATASGVVLAPLFFAPAGRQVAVLVAFASSGIGFLFRPLGAFIAGHLGDRVGRRPVLVGTLILMGVATTAVGLLPTYHQIGLAAPVLLLVLRVLQGLSAGGEWGGAVLLAVEHAPVRRRGFFGTAPQIGVPLGLLLASGALGLMSVLAPGDAFLAWGWRVPFLASVVLIAVGHYVRRRVGESPVFTELAARKKVTSRPIAALFRTHAPLVLVVALVMAGTNGPSYMIPGGFLQQYVTDPDTGIGLELSPVLAAVTFSSLVWLATTWIAGTLSDRVGRRRMFMIGWAVQAVAVLALFPLVNTGEIALFLLAICLLNGATGITMGPMSSFFAELFPSSIRASGISISYAVGAVLGGAFAPLIAQWLLRTTGTSGAITVYLVLLTAVGLAATAVLRDRTGIALGADAGAEEALPFVGRRGTPAQS
ncbi:MFS transporter [Xylanimonas allomyrinae]|uniref:MFS transporter n=1 Tax=Xylanimonas allomyrinae TaxID=2509459 RepID=A0A4P6EX48_9MICO|nr:MFS transporter [Xylanimonas allomyrinae]QAY62588.1 MFS transporter [Xylanimonas allomyrinae]